MTYTKDIVGPTILSHVEFLKGLIKAGTLVVPDTQEKLDAFVVPEITLP
jgi:basic membrane protein A